MKAFTLLSSLAASVFALNAPRNGDTQVIPLDSPLLTSEVQGEHVLPRMSQTESVFHCQTSFKVLPFADPKTAQSEKQ
jgi:hypothetical protein